MLRIVRRFLPKSSRQSSSSGHIEAGQQNRGKPPIGVFAHLALTGNFLDIGGAVQLFNNAQGVQMSNTEIITVLGDLIQHNHDDANSNGIIFFADSKIDGG